MRQDDLKMLMQILAQNLTEGQNGEKKKVSARHKSNADGKKYSLTLYKLFV